MTSLMTDESGITLGMIMSHMQAMEVWLTWRIDSVGRSLTARMDRLEGNLTGQIDAIDKRLDAIEIEMPPKRVAALGVKVR